MAFTTVHDETIREQSEAYQGDDTVATVRHRCCLWPDGVRGIMRSEDYQCRVSVRQLGQRSRDQQDQDPDMPLFV